MIIRTVPINAFFETETAALLVQTASGYKSRLSLQLDNKTASAKSIMGVISLALAEGDNLTITAEGADETEALAALEGFVKAQL